MKEEISVGDIFEDIAERVAMARTRALMGERKEALAMLQKARMDFHRFREVLHGYPGSLALENSIASAQATLREERAKEGSKVGDRPAKAGPKRKAGGAERAA